MKKSVWDRFAPVYSLAMKSQKHIYDYMYSHISSAVAGKEMLELATGPGLIARQVAGSAKRVVATDFSPKMIEQAMKGQPPANVSFEIADAANLRYGDKSFDVVVIANALHVVPDPVKVLSEIDRVLRDGGMLICPTFIHRAANSKENLWAKVLKAVGIQFAHQWTADEFRSFIETNGWKISAGEVVPGRIDLFYAECVRA